MRRWAVLVLVVGGIAWRESVAQGRLTQAEALRLAFPAPATIERRTAFLSDAELDRVRALAGGDVEVRQRVVTYYVAARDATPVGVAYFDAHRVRTLNEVLMIVVTPVGRVERVEIVAFDEPPEYRAADSWLGQLDGRALDHELSLKGAIINMTGATLTAQAVVRAVRRVLAYHEVIRPFRTVGGAAR